MKKIPTDMYYKIFNAYLDSPYYGVLISDNAVISIKHINVVWLALMGMLDTLDIMGIKITNG